jgi:hypothetical protein
MTLLNRPWKWLDGFDAAWQVGAPTSQFESIIFQSSPKLRFPSITYQLESVLPSTLTL